MTLVDDVIRGQASFPNANMDDPVIARADGSVLYNFAVAIDDLDAGITHVVRGEDHLSNTPKQLLVFEALGAPAPRYAHLPLLLGPDGRKLSKRHGAASVQELREAGYLPEAVDNYIALLGAGFASDEEHFSAPGAGRPFPAGAGVQEPGGVRRAQAPAHERRWTARAGRRGADRRLEELTGRSGTAPGGGDRGREDPDPDEFWPLVSFLFEGPAEDPEAFDTGDRLRRRRGDAGAARDGPGRGRALQCRDRRAALRGVVEAREISRARFPARTGGAGGHDRVAGDFESVALLGREETLRPDRQALNRGEARQANRLGGLNQGRSLPIEGPHGSGSSRLLAIRAAWANAERQMRQLALSRRRPPKRASTPANVITTRVTVAG